MHELDIFERLLEEDAWVQAKLANARNKALEEGKKEGQLLTARKVLIDMMAFRFPALRDLAQERVSRCVQLQPLEQALQRLMTAPDEQAARSVLTNLPVPDDQSS